MMEMMGGKVEKRNGGEQEQGPKNKFINSMQLLITKNNSRNMTKEDITWECVEFEGDKKTYQVSVTITSNVGPEGNRTFSGEVCDSKKKAEASAAQIAYDSMK